MVSPSGLLLLFFHSIYFLSPLQMIINLSKYQVFLSSRFKECSNYRETRNIFGDLLLFLDTLRPQPLPRNVFSWFTYYNVLQFLANINHLVVNLLHSLKKLVLFAMFLRCGWLADGSVGNLFVIMPFTYFQNTPIFGILMLEIYESL